MNALRFPSPRRKLPMICNMFGEKVAEGRMRATLAAAIRGGMHP